MQDLNANTINKWKIWNQFSLILEKLSFISKLVERAAVKQINKYNNSNETTPLYQLGNHNYENALIKLLNNTLLDMELGLVMVLVCIHLNAESDNVDHYSLLNILFGVIIGL